MDVRTTTKTALGAEKALEPAARRSSGLKKLFERDYSYTIQLIYQSAGTSNAQVP